MQLNNTVSSFKNAGEVNLQSFFLILLWFDILVSAWKLMV